MSLTFDESKGDPVHTPKRRDVFEFDHEVASIFENMAVRSIPMYAETHKVHAAIAKGYADDKFDGQYAVADIGASTGMFLKSLTAGYGLQLHQSPSYFRATAIDPSQHMLDEVSRQLPWVSTANIEAQYMGMLKEKFHVVNASYVFQFIPEMERIRAMQSIANCMYTGGLLFVSQKCRIPGLFDHYIVDEYIRFRKDNGYSEEEIAAKTKALKKSMWPDRLDNVKDMLQTFGFWDFQDTTSWLNFSSFVCVKQDG